MQRVRLVGEPPKDKSCFFRHLRNVVVMPSRGGTDIKGQLNLCNSYFSPGDRPLALGLGGGDLDGSVSLVFREINLKYRF